MKEIRGGWGGEGIETGRTRSQTVIYKHENILRKGKKQRTERIKNEIQDEHKVFS
jgi:hypothetical protein